jgi:holo-[acyl-carrier protein] synthase
MDKNCIVESKNSLQNSNILIRGIGTDIVQIPRIEKLYEKFGDKFLYKNYHDLEIKEFFKLNPQKRCSFLAKRFAGKEAISKALGIGMGLLQFKDIAIVNDDLGAPFVKIFNHLIDDLTTYSIHISLSDDYPIAIAFALITK